MRESIDQDITDGRGGPGPWLIRTLGADRVLDVTAADTAKASPERADLVVCRDVAEVRDREAYRLIVGTVVQAGRLGALISGYDAEPFEREPSSHYHEPLLVTIESIDHVTAIPLSARGGLVTYLALRDPVNPHPRDITASTLRRSVPLTTDHLDLIRSVSSSRSVLGFFPNHLARCLEYPWVLGRLRAFSHGNLRVADVGAGLSVVPILLHDDGHEITTIDDHRIDRTSEDPSLWNEWGFFDYSRLRAGIRSVHAPFEEFDPPGPFDVMYSVSVIEHLQAGVRRRWLSRMADQLRPGGRLLLTVDIEPFSRRLWRYSEGRLVEDAATHGTVDDLIHELRARGFSIDRVEVREWLPTSRVGLAFVEATRP